MSSLWSGTMIYEQTESAMAAEDKVPEAELGMGA